MSASMVLSVLAASTLRSRQMLSGKYTVTTFLPTTPSSCAGYAGLVGKLRHAPLGVGKP
jgi:uncharacterized membrane protein